LCARRDFICGSEVNCESGLTYTVPSEWMMDKAKRENWSDHCGGILVETFGGSAEDISEKGLRQTDAQEMAEKLKSVLVDRA